MGAAIIATCNNETAKRYIDPAQLCGVLWIDETIFKDQFHPVYGQENSKERQAIRSLLNCKCGRSTPIVDRYGSGVFLWSKESEYLLRGHQTNLQIATQESDFSVCPWCSLDSKFVRRVMKLGSRSDHIGDSVLHPSFEAKLSEGFFLYEGYRSAIRNWIWEQEKERREKELDDMRPKGSNNGSPAGNISLPNHRKRSGFKAR